MNPFILALLVGCSTPSEIAIDGDAKIVVHSLDAEVALPSAKVLDQNGAAIEPAPKISWTVAKTDVAELSADGSKIKPKADGETDLTASLNDLTKSVQLVVSLPDAIELSGYTAGTPVPATTTVTLSAAVMADGAALTDQAVTWSSSDDTKATVADGVVTGVADGTATITATSGALSSAVEVTVGAAAPVAADASAPK